MRRGDVDWVAMVEKTGRWDDPPYWRDPKYLAESPLSEAELDQVFGALLRIYTPARARAIFRRRDPSLWPLLVAPFSALVSRFVALGEDAIACEAWTRKSFVDALVADGRSFEGAFFEITFFAALKRAGVACAHEPLAFGADGSARAKGEPNPDFSAEVAGRDLLLELKASRESAESREHRGWLNELAMAGEKTADIPFEIEALPAFGEMQERDGRSWMRRHIKGIVGRVEDAKERLAASGGPFPAVEVIDDCLRLKVRGPRGSGPSGGAMGPLPNFAREAQRIVRGLVADGATQIPSDRIGVVVVESGWSVDDEYLAPEIRRWFSDEGAAYPQVVGAAIVSNRYALDYELTLTFVTPVWRESAPRVVRESDVWDRLSTALSLRQMRGYQFRTGKSIESLFVEPADGGS